MYYYLYTVLFVVRKVFTNFNNFHQELSYVDHIYNG